MKQKITRSKPVGLAMILGLLYLVYSFSYYYGDITSSYVSVSMGAQVARILILPHLLFTLLAVCVNTFGFMQNRDRYVFASSLFYVAAIVLFPRATIFLLPECVLNLIGFFRMPEEYQVIGGMQ